MLALRMAAGRLEGSIADFGGYVLFFAFSSLTFSACVPRIVSSLQASAAVYPQRAYILGTHTSTIYSSSLSLNNGKLLFPETNTAQTNFGGSSSGTTCLTVDPSGRWIYMPNFDQNLISQFTVNSETGLPVAMTTPSVATGNAPQCLVTDQLSRWAYIPNRGSNTISQYSINSTSGELSPLPVPTVLTGSSPTSVVIHPTKPWLYVVNLVSNTVEQFTINTSTGELSSSPTSSINDQGHVATASGINQGMVMDSTGTFLYVSLYLKDEIAQFSISQTTGHLTALTPAPADAGPQGIVMHPSGNWLYVASGYYGTVQPFTINSGLLTPLTSIAAIAPFTLAVDPTGQYLFAGTNYFNINSTTGLPSGSQTLFDVSLLGVAFNSTGDQIYFDIGSKAIQEWKFDPLANYPFESILAPTATTPTAFEPLDMAFHPSGNWAYVLGETTIFQYNLNRIDGSLEPLNPTEINAESSPVQLLVDPSGHWAYVLSNSFFTGNSTVAQYEIGSDGTLSEVNSAIVTLTGFSSLTITASGKWAFLVNYDNNVIYQYRLNSSTGDFSPLPSPTINIGADASNLVFDSTEKWALTANNSDDSISEYSLDPKSGQLTAVATIPLLSGSQPGLITFHPTLGFLYVLNYGNNTISEFSIQEATGALILVNNLTFDSDYSPISLVIDRSGQWAYFMNEKYSLALLGGAVEQFSIDSVTGILASVGLGDVSVLGGSNGLFLF